VSLGCVGASQFLDVFEVFFWVCEGYFFLTGCVFGGVLVPVPREVTEAGPRDVTEAL
jgi:hypothetical protein